jgi:hypothetical protein
MNDNDFLENCKARLLEAQKRLQESQQELQAAQIKFQTANQEVASFQYMIAFETRKEQERSGFPMGPATPNAAQPQSSRVTEINKTDLVRQTLQRHAGMTSLELWTELKSQISSRNYLYSILKRLRDNDEVTVKRKKYSIKFSAKLNETREHQLVQ